MEFDDALNYAVKRWPQIMDYLNDNAKARLVKSLDYYQRTLRSMVQNVYSGYMGGDFMLVLDNLVLGQLSEAFERAARDNGLSELTPDLFSAMMDMVQSERSHIQDFYRAIVDARVDQTPVDPLLARADLWAARWTDAYNEAVRLITVAQGGKLMWQLGATEEHCTSCAALNGIIAFASEWETSGIKPQSPQNPYLACGGWRCDCSLVPTDGRRSPKALDRLLDIAVSARL